MKHKHEPFDVKFELRLQRSLLNAVEHVAADRWQRPSQFMRDAIVDALKARNALPSPGEATAA
jgi:hypothetical protein